MRLNWMTPVRIPIDDAVVTTTSFSERIRIVRQANRYVRIIAYKHPALDGIGHVCVPTISLVAGNRTQMTGKQ
jgi:hypothetical protein